MQGIPISRAGTVDANLILEDFLDSETEEMVPETPISVLE